MDAEDETVYVRWHSDYPWYDIPVEPDDLAIRSARCTTDPSLNHDLLCAQA